MNLVIFLTYIKKTKLMKSEQFVEALVQEFKTRDEESEFEMLANIKATVRNIYEKHASKSCIIFFFNLPKFDEIS